MTRAPADIYQQHNPGFPEFPIVIGGSPTGTRMEVHSDGSLHLFNNANAEILTMLATGLIGIGQTNPIFDLEIGTGSFTHSIFADTYYGPGSAAAAELGGAFGHRHAFGWDAGAIKFYVDGVFEAALTGTKSFTIEHPHDPDRWLVHGCLEGPEAGVYQRGRQTLAADGRREIVLPAYWPDLVDELTANPFVSGLIDTTDDPFGPIAATPVRNGAFTVVGQPGQRFAWQVIATRRDVASLVVEPRKTDVTVRRYGGPYSSVEPRRSRAA